MAGLQGMEAFVTMATNDEYAIGALVLGQSLRDVRTTRQLVVMTSTYVTPAMRQRLSLVYDVVKTVDLLDSHDHAHLELLSRPELGVTLTKINCWKLTQFKKCVFLDADTLVLQNIDDLFERDEFSAAPDAGWPDCFNSGVFVFVPSDETYHLLLQFIETNGSFDGGDQGLLNSFFSDWSTKDIARHLPFVYNVVAQAFYSYRPALKQFGKDVKVVHFIGSQKPWHLRRDTQDWKCLGDLGSVEEFMQLWWKIFREKCQTTITTSNHSSASHDEMFVAPSEQTLSSPVDPPSVVIQGLAMGDLEEWRLANPNRQFDWEKGQIDYMGKDRFENIQKRIDENLSESNAKEETSIETKIKSTDETK